MRVKAASGGLTGAGPCRLAFDRPMRQRLGPAVTTVKRGEVVGNLARVNIIQVAKAAGVSVATVSRSFKKPERLKPATLKHVRAVVAEMGYVPNIQARNLRTSRTGSVLALVPDISKAFSAAIIRGMERVAYENDYNVLLGDTQNDRTREQAYAQLLAARHVDGLITLIPRKPAVDFPGRLPIVNVSSGIDDDSITHVQIDNVAAAEEATDLLLAMGHRNIGLISGSVSSPIFAIREQGYRAALGRAGVDVAERWITSAALSVEGGIAATELLLSRDSTISAIFCASDEIAIGAIKAIKRAGLGVPQDVSVIGFDDDALSRHFEPPLTTVAQPLEQMGQEAMRLLIEILQDPTTPPRKRVLSSQLVVRGSTGVNRRR